MAKIKIADLNANTIQKLTPAEVAKITGGGDVDGRDFLVWQRHVSSSALTRKFADVLKTPTPGGPVPMPYPIVG